MSHIHVGKGVLHRLRSDSNHRINLRKRLRIPDKILGDRRGVDRWLQEHEDALSDLAEQRRIAAEAYRDEVIRNNMRELIDLLVSDPDMLPCEAAERISVRRLAKRERDRTAAEIMADIPTIPVMESVGKAASMLVVLLFRRA